MYRFALTMAAAGLSLGTALPVQAQEMAIDPTNFTCAEFTALDREAQAMAIVALTKANDAMSDVKGTGDSGSNSDVTEVNTVCAGNDAMLVKDALPAH